MTMFLKNEGFKSHISTTCIGMSSKSFIIIIIFFQMNLNALTDEGIETILKAVNQNQTLTYVSLQVFIQIFY